MKNNLSLLSQRGFFTLFAFFLIISAPIFAAPRYEDDVSIRELKDGLSSVSHEVDNHETEIRMLEERINNQEATISSLRQQVLDANQVNKQLVKGSSTNVDTKISQLETANKNLVSDLVLIKTHSNETANILSQYKQKVVELEKIIQLQNQNIDNLQSALRLLTDALQDKNSFATKSLPPSNSKTYRVKAGDSLDRIARSHQTTAKAIKDLNNLSNDRIIVGQTLQMP